MCPKIVLEWPSCGHNGPSWGHLGAILGHLGAIYAFALVDHTGVFSHLGDGPPALLRSLIRQRYAQVIADEAVKARRPDGVLRTQEWLDLEARGIFLEPLQKVLRAGGKKRLSHVEKCHL